jgi:hypothetical protein
MGKTTLFSPAGWIAPNFTLSAPGVQRIFGRNDRYFGISVAFRLSNPQN